MPGFRMTASLRHADEALLTLEGPMGPAETAQAATMLEALLDAGTRQLLVDVAAVRPGDPGLAVRLDDVRHRLTALGGWLVVDPPGESLPRDPADARAAADPAADPAADEATGDDGGQLAELFGIYRRVIAPARVPACASRN